MWFLLWFMRKLTPKLELTTIASFQLVLVFILSAWSRPHVAVASPYVFIPAAVIILLMLILPEDMTRRHMRAGIQGKILAY